ncbi:phosphotyrosine protein phosphatases I [Venturia nashicola]|nr:phosphotyrosine protein phosphatases I [Venturia nashicola]
MASSSISEPVSVLFVCLGNICRSPMAEGVFRHVTNHPDHPLIADVDSAGTGGYHTGSSPDARTMKTLKANGITKYKHGARKVTAEDFEKFHWIFAMDSDNLDDLRSMRDRSRRRQAKGETTEGRNEMGKIMLFGDFGGRKGEQVVDPYYGADDGFATAYEQMVRFTDGFLKHLEETKSTAEKI